MGLLLLSLGLTSVPKVHSQTQDAKILDYTYYIDPEGMLDVIGEVQNVGSSVLSSVTVAGAIYSAKTGGTDLDNSYDYAWVTNLLPNQKAPFYLEFYAPTTGSDQYWDAAVTYYPYLSIAAANTTSSYQYPDLTVTSSTGMLGTGANANYTDVYYVNGVIKNTGDQTASGLAVVATFYNSTGSIVAVGNTENVLEQTSLAPSQTVQFTVPAFDLNQSVVPASWRITNYALLIQAEEPVLQGTPPAVVTFTGGSSTSSQTGTSSTSSPSQSLQPSASPTNSFAKYYVVIAAAAVILVAAVAALLVLRRSKDVETTKETRKAAKKKRS